MAVGTAGNDQGTLAQNKKGAIGSLFHLRRTP
jgi:hypothetical protein